MKIIHIANLGQENYNGITEVVKHLSTAQLKLGHEVLVFHLYTRCVIELDSHIQIVDSYKKFKESINLFKPDIIIFHSIYKPQYFRFMRFCIKNKIPYLVTFHGGANKTSLNKGKWKKCFANLIFVNKFIKNSSGIIYLNENEKINDSRFSKFAPNYILNNGVNLPLNTHYNPIKSDKVRFLFLGRYDYLHKGIDIFIDALDIIYKEIKDKAVFNFYGQGAYDQLKNDTEKFRDIVSVNCSVYDSEKEAAFFNSDVFLLPSRFEGMPIVILEALSYGLPCIITRQTNMVELVKDAGKIIDCDAESLANAILFFTNSGPDKLRYMSDKALEYIKPMTWDNIALQSINLYMSIINKNN